MTKLKTQTFIFLMLAFGLIFSRAGSVSAQDEEAEKVLTLSRSGFEQAKSLAFSQDGSFLAVGGTSGVYIYDTRQYSELSYLPVGAWARSVAFQPGSNLLAAAVFDGTLKFWQGPKFDLVQTLSGSVGWFRSIAFSGDGSLVASASDDDTLRVWKTGEEAPFLVINQAATGIRAVAISPDGKLVAGAMGSDNAVRVWQVQTGELLYTLKGHTDWVRCLAFSPDGLLLASGSFDKNIRLWKMDDGSLQAVLEGHTASVLGIAFSPDGGTLASGSVDQTVRLWDVKTAAPVKMMLGHSGFVYSVAYSPDGNTLASGSADNTVRLWNVRDLPKPSAPGSIPGPETPSDCRMCHHRRGMIEPARVIELSCEGCHSGGIGLSWCRGFPRSSRAKTGPIPFKWVEDNKGVPVNNRDISVVIASPGNSETLYVRGGALGPEFVTGRVYISDPAQLKNVSVRLDIVSGGKTTASLLTHPQEGGEFEFKLAINPELSPPQLSKPGTRQCLICHGEFVPEAGLPKGDVQLVVRAVAPDGQEAFDERWIHVDPSNTASVPVEVLDAETRAPLSNINVDSSALLYEWRDRFGSTSTGPDGSGTLLLDALSQKSTSYDVVVPPQVVNGVKYASLEPVQVVLDADSIDHGKVTLLASAVTGQIQGGISIPAEAVQPASLQVWAVQLPYGPLNGIKLEGSGNFNYQKIPVSQYLVVPDSFALAEKGLQTTNYMVDLFQSPLANVSFSLETGRLLNGMIQDENGSPLPFGWVKAGSLGGFAQFDPATGKYLYPNDPGSPAFITVLAPGYYSQSKSVTGESVKLDFKLVPRPETRRTAWGDGFVVVPPETVASVNGLDFTVESGWLWGQAGTAAQPVLIHLPEWEIEVSNGKFALESPAKGQGWLYVYQGKALMTYAGKPAVEVNGGQMVALHPNAAPMTMEPAVALALHPAAGEAPVVEIIEPTLSARIQTWLVKTGIGAMQMITYITYILSLVTLIAIPLLGLSLYRKYRRKTLDDQEKK